MAQALRFECQAGCTACCRQQGFVYLSEPDLRRIAEFLGVTPAAFEKQYVYRTRKRLRLRVPRASQCYFLGEAGCAIHPVKPAQCRIFPFWPELLESRREWRKTARYCPGMNQGPLVHIEVAREQAREMREAYPEMY
ncbi:MAG: YkgJ family cysteine cluster protein [Acidobacteriia bacterium]|nr:YkgJ family cysteine cluster protein [Terriglobia bacterium]